MLRNCLLAVALIAASIGGSFDSLFDRVSTGFACDTPVYRYAMYRWEPTPYEIYFFHDAKPSEKDEAIASFIESLSEGEKERGNAVYLPVDISDDPDLVKAQIPLDVKRAWLDQTVKSTPGYAIISPMGQKIFIDDLTLAEVKSLVDSPLRKEVSQSLAEGKAGVLILVTHPEAVKPEGEPTLWQMMHSGKLLRQQFGRSNEEAVAEVKKLVADVADGKLDLYGGPGDKFPGENLTEGAQPEELPALAIDWLQLDRNNKEEKWLLRQLLAVEPDLHEIKQPMVFCIYGRGRALPPFAGLGVQRDLLVDVVDFITGACSCTIKDQNPGVDLLMTSDWNAIAAKLADKFGSEEGNETVGETDFFPEIIVPAPLDPTGGEDLTSISKTGSWVETFETLASDEPPGPSSENEVASAKPVLDPVKPVVNSRDKSPSKQVASNDKSVVTPQEVASKTAGVMFFSIVVGIGVTLFVLIGATLFMFQAR